jgi:hypothetical protein
MVLKNRENVFNQLLSKKYRGHFPLGVKRPEHEAGDFLVFLNPDANTGTLK